MKKELKYRLAIILVFVLCFCQLQAQISDSVPIRKIKNFFPDQEITQFQKREKPKSYPISNVKKFDSLQIPEQVKKALPVVKNSRVELQRKGENWLIKNSRNELQYVIYRKNDSVFLEKPVVASYAVPFVKEAPRQYLRVAHQLKTGNKKDTAISSVSFFAADGSFLGSESISKITDPRRMQLDFVEKGMQGIKHSVLGFVSSPENFDYQKMWQVIDKVAPVKQIKEFSLYFVNYRFEDNSVKPVVILNIWGPDNPLGMPDSFPTILKNRIRIIYNPADNTWMADNFL